MKSSRFLRCAAGATGASRAATLGASAPPFSSSPSASAAGSVHSTLHSLRTRDITLRVPSKDHLVRFSFCSTRYLLAETIRRHNLLRLTGANLPFLQLLGTQLTFTNLLASAEEGEERVETRFTAEEATILTEALALGECRCYLRPEYNAELAEQGLPTFPLRVNRILYRQHAPFTSVVHADLAELLQPPAKEGSGAAADTAVPFSLYIPTMASRVPPEAWGDFFAYNSTLHAYNYLRRSDGCVPAVWMHAALDAAVLHADDLLHPDGTAVSTDTLEVNPVSTAEEDDGKTAEKAAEALQRTLRHAISHSFGAFVTPLAAGSAVDQRVGQLNRALTEAAVLLHRPAHLSTAANSPSPLQPLLDRCKEKHTTCQHVLSLLSGDYDGAQAAAVAARQFSEDPGAVAAVVDPIRHQLGVHDFTIPLAAAEVVRTGLDFFCRCSKQSALTSLAAAPASALTSLKANHGVLNCSFCGKHYQLGAEDWAELEKARATPPAAPAA